MVIKETKTRLDVSAAVVAARDSLRLIEKFLDYNLEDLRLEEVELSEDKKKWLITMSFFPKSPGEKESFRFDSERVYKIVKINAKRGNLESIKRRKNDS